MNDVNEQVKSEWKAETTARERVREVLLETTEYATAAEIADRALVSEPTARKFLNELVEDGVGVTDREGRTTRSKRHEHRLVQDRIEELRTEHTHQELVDAIREMNERIQEFRETYGVERPEDLAVELEPGEEGWADVGRWRSTRQNLALAKAALQVDEAHRLVEA
ncbi:transcriptional regulator [Halobacteriales archaeon QS_1_68_20]|nr:MAG: transcriptional regulator [Halobacteriales archaeon QS_1_68_20]